MSGCAEPWGVEELGAEGGEDGDGGAVGAGGEVGAERNANFEVGFGAGGGSSSVSGVENSRGGG